ncbi:MAG TPA: MFS transporter [Candidatus Saccharimonadia bacterium]|jgi:MFS family permease|nr:MFS transporter [Candidatus Saccharimonadia bacterium]
MNLFGRQWRLPSSRLAQLGSLHILNDGFLASYLLLLPFIARSQHLNLTQVGSLGTVISAASIVLALPAGYLAAKFGGLRTLVAALFVYATGMLGAGVFGHYYWLLVVFGLGGIGFGVFHPIAFALIAKWSVKETRGRAMGNFTAIGDVGRIGISAALSFVVAYIGWQNTALVYATVALVAAVVFYRFLRSQQDTSSQEKKVAGPPMALRAIAKNRRFVLAMAASACDGFASASLYVFLPFLLLKRGVSPAFLGTFTGAFFVGNLLGKVMLGRTVDKLGSIKVFIASEILMAGFIFMLANSTALPVIVFCAVVLGAFTKGTLPVLQAMLSESVEHHGNFEKAFGLSALVASTAVTVAPFVLGFVSDKLGIIPAFNVMAVVALCAIVPATGYALSRPNPIRS